MAYSSIVAILASLDFYSFVLPFLLIFSVVYALVKQIGIFNDNKISSIIALVIALFATAVGGDYLASFFINFFGGSMMYLSAILISLIFLAMVGLPTSMKEASANKKWVVGLFLLALVVALFLGATGSIGYISISGELTGAVVALLVIGIIVYFVTSGSSGSSGPENSGEQPSE